MPVDMNRMSDQWLVHLPATTSTGTEFFRDACAAYSEPHRHYHTLEHIGAMLRWLEPVIPGNPAIFWATWFHDYVYDPLRPDNEERSADIAEEQLAALGIDAECSAVARQLILATKTHKPDPTLSTDHQLFLDADMAILGAEPAIYDRYADNVRREFAVVPDEAYSAGRRAFLAKTLAMPDIFGTEEFKLKREAQARANLQRELLRFS